jgi:hypothetical protein
MTSVPGTIRNVVIVGYPKSGTTWITRLVADLIGAPVAGFWGALPGHHEIAQEGEDRQSPCRCFKGHHQLAELKLDAATDATRVIYVVRDPRDITISGASYFRGVREPRGAAGAALRRYRRVRRVYHRFSRALVTERFRIGRMMDAVLYGAPEVHNWCRIPWKAHYPPYLEQGVLCVRYEDMLDDPVAGSHRILSYLGVEARSPEVRAAVDRQSFDRRRAGFLADGRAADAAFLRAGKYGQWRQKLTADEKDRFLGELADQLDSFAYPLALP